MQNLNTLIQNNFTMDIMVSVDMNNTNDETHVILRHILELEEKNAKWNIIDGIENDVPPVTFSVRSVNPFIKFLTNSSRTMYLIPLKTMLHVSGLIGIDLIKFEAICHIQRLHKTLDKILSYNDFTKYKSPNLPHKDGFEAMSETKAMEKISRNFIKKDLNMEEHYGIVNRNADEIHLIRGLVSCIDTLKRMVNDETYDLELQSAREFLAKSIL